MMRMWLRLGVLHLIPVLLFGCASQQPFVTSRAVGVLERAPGKYERVFFQTSEKHDAPGIHCEENFTIVQQGAGKSAKVAITYAAESKACGEGRPLFLSVFEVGVVCSSDGDFETASTIGGELQFNRRCTAGHVSLDSPVVDARRLDPSGGELVLDFPRHDVFYLLVAHEEASALSSGSGQTPSNDKAFLYHGTRTFYVHGWRFVRLSHRAPRVVLVGEKTEALVDYFRRDIAKRPEGCDLTNILVSFDASMRTFEAPQPELCPKLPPHRSTALKFAFVNLSLAGGATVHPVTYELSGWSQPPPVLNDKNPQRISGQEFPLYGEILVAKDDGFLVPDSNRAEVYQTFDARYRPGLKVILGGRYTEFTGHQMADSFDEVNYLNVQSTTLEAQGALTYTVFATVRHMFHLEAGAAFASRRVSYDSVLIQDSLPKLFSVPEKSALTPSVFGGLSYRHNPLDGPYGTGRSLFGAEVDVFGLYQAGSGGDIDDFGFSDFAAGNVGMYWFPGRGNLHLHAGTLADHQFDLSATRVGPYAGISWRSNRTSSGLRLDVAPSWYVSGSHFSGEDFSFAVRGKILTPYGGIGVKYSVLGTDFGSLDFLGLEYVQNFDFDLGFARSFVDMFRAPRNPGGGE
jgi:hypothetical protein